MVSKKEFIKRCQVFCGSDRFYCSWSGGGTCGNCWNDVISTISAKPEEDLKDLDQFLAKYYPNISFMQYKGICTHINYDENGYSDYYGGHTTTFFKEITFEKLYEVMKEMELL